MLAFLQLFAACGVEQAGNVRFTRIISAEGRDERNALVEAAGGQKAPGLGKATQLALLGFVLLQVAEQARNPFIVRKLPLQLGKQ